MTPAIEAALQHDVAGDPITGIRWTHRTTENIAAELAGLGIQVCPRTVARILKELDYRLRVNHKRVSAGSGPGLCVTAQLVDQEYPKGVKISDNQFDSIALERHQLQPLRNYTICPRS